MQKLFPRNVCYFLNCVINLAFDFDETALIHSTKKMFWTVLMRKNEFLDRKNVKIDICSIILSEIKKFDKITMRDAVLINVNSFNRM